MSGEASGIPRWARAGAGLPRLDLAFLLAAAALLGLGFRDAAVRTFSLLYASIVLEALPFMLLGALVGGAVEVLVSRERMAALLPRRRWLAVPVAAALGVVFPVCECAVVPVVRRLSRKGLPVSSAVAYLLGAPIANPIVAASTAVAYRFEWRVVAARVLGGYAIAVVAGLLVDRLLRGRTVYHPGVEEGPADGRPCCAHPDHGACRAAGAARPAPWRRAVEALHHAADDLLGVGRYFVIGAFVAALAQAFLDRSLLLEVTGRPALAILAMMILAIALNLCSEADAFVASSFRGFMPLSAQLAFLLLGPILDLKLLLMYQTLFRRRVIGLLAAASFLLVLMAASGLHLSGGFGP